MWQSKSYSKFQQFKKTNPRELQTDLSSLSPDIFIDLSSLSPDTSVGHSYFVRGEYSLSNGNSAPAVCFYDTKAPPIGSYFPLNHCFSYLDDSFLYTTSLSNTNITLNMDFYSGVGCRGQAQSYPIEKHTTLCEDASDLNLYMTGALTNSIPDGLHMRSCFPNYFFKHTIENIQKYMFCLAPILAWMRKWQVLVVELTAPNLKQFLHTAPDSVSTTWVSRWPLATLAIVTTTTINDRS